MKIETQYSISKWAEDTFGPVSALDAARRMLKEAQELVECLEADPNHPKAPEECADVYVTLVRVSQVLKSKLHTEVNRKMDINRKRTWVLNGDGTGQHA